MASLDSDKQAWDALWNAVEDASKAAAAVGMPEHQIAKVIIHSAAMTYYLRCGKHKLAARDLIFDAANDAIRYMNATTL